MSRRLFASSRRKFLQQSGVLLAGFAAGHGHSRIARIGASSPTLLNLDSLEHFVDPLPIPRVARPIGTRPHPEQPSVKIPYYRLAMRQVESKIHRDVKPTRFWGYGDTSPGPVIEARSGDPLLFEWANELPTAHFLPIDYTVHGSEKDKPDVRVVSHLHGAKTRPENDGYPTDWYVPGKSKTYFYPNQQDAAMLWYHDHAMGITRLNVYAGLFGLYFLRDSFEDRLNLPKGKHEIPLMLYDRSFDTEGQLSYFVSPNIESPWMPESSGGGTLVNGKLFPYLEVEPAKYRFRLLNCANAGFFDLSLSGGLEFHQIGTDLGFLPAPVSLKKLDIAPGERADLIVDFSAHAGESIVLSDGIRPIMQFRVAKTAAIESGILPAALRPVPKIPESAAVKTRLLTLGEMDDRIGNAMTMLLNNSHWDMPVTENPALDSVEIWSLANFTDDSHPIHLHGVRFQILDRQSFDSDYYYKGGQVKYTGNPELPAANESGWKDTVQAHPDMITRIITRFEGFPGRYVWHCHILEHEDNEMMRPYDIVAPK
jgi:spore coat protein A